MRALMRAMRTRTSRQPLRASRWKIEAANATNGTTRLSHQPYVRSYSSSALGSGVGSGLDNWRSAWDDDLALAEKDELDDQDRELVAWWHAQELAEAQDRSDEVVARLPETSWDNVTAQCAQSSWDTRPIIDA